MKSLIKNKIEKTQEKLKLEKDKQRVLKSYRLKIKDLRKKYSQKFLVNFPVSLKLDIRDGEINWFYDDTKHDFATDLDIFVLDYLNHKDRKLNKSLKDMAKEYDNLYKSFVKEMEFIIEDKDLIDDLFFELSK